MSNPLQDSRIKEREDQAKRDQFIEKALGAFAKDRIGVEHCLLWARQGQYGKGELVLCTDVKGYAVWVDPAGLPDDTVVKLCVRSDEAAMMAACLSTKGGVSYCVFRRHYVPRWSITDSEILTVYQKLG